MEAITDFRNEHAFLSNFYPCQIELDGVVYPSIEHAFQAAKTFDHTLRRKIRNSASPSSAKALGRKLDRRKDWFSVSLTIMESLVRQKFTQDTNLGEKLLNTGDTILIEGNNWNDRFYGCIWDSKKHEWVGENHLGHILMKVRNELRVDHE